MAKWLDNFRTGRLGGPDLIQKMMEKPTLTTGGQSFYGAGLGMEDYRGVATAGHSGQTGGFKSELVYCPELEVGVAVLGNAGWMQAHDIARRILDIYLAEELEPLAEASADVSGGTSDIPAYDLDPSEYGPFLDGQGEEGTFDRLLVTLRGEEMPATRVEIPINPDWVDECVGFYYSDEIDAAYEIVRESDGLAVRAPNSGNRPLEPADTDILAGGIGLLTFRRGDDGEVVGFDFGEPEDLGRRQIPFTRCKRSK